MRNNVLDNWESLGGKKWWVERKRICSAVSVIIVEITLSVPNLGNKVACMSKSYRSEAGVPGKSLTLTSHTQKLEIWFSLSLGERQRKCLSYAHTNPPDLLRILTQTTLPLRVSSQAEIWLLELLGNYFFRFLNLFPRPSGVWKLRNSTWHLFVWQNSEHELPLQPGPCIYESWPREQLGKGGARGQEEEEAAVLGGK